MDYKCEIHHRGKKVVEVKQQGYEGTFEYQPERSKREDSHCFNCFELEKAAKNCFSQNGICPKCGRHVGCGALNTDESQ